jgi:hypothetical protein
MKTPLLALTFLILYAQATPPRDTSATRSSGTAVIRGRVTAAATKQPLHRVRITLNAQNPNPPTAVTDTRGEFEFTSLPAGFYSMTATRAGYLPLQYGQRRPQEPGRTIELQDGETLERVDMALVRGGVLSGVISDDAGDLYPGVRVEALEFRYLRGRRVLVQANSAITNDLGQYRLPSLPPGIYFLRASSTDTWEGDDGANTFAYATTYYPGVTGSDQAEPLTLGIGQDLTNLNFALRPGRAATITGVLQTATGEPVPSQTIHLSRATRGVGGALFSTQAGAADVRTDASGSFTFSKLAPGEFIVGTGTEADSATVSVVVAEGDVRQVVLTPRKRAALSGTVVSDDGSPVLFPSSRLRIVPVPADPESLLPSFTGPGATSVGRDWTFRLTNMTGQYLFRVDGLPPEWMLAGVMLNARAITDTPLSIRPGDADISGVQVVLSRKGGKVDGQVVLPDGGAAPDSTVLVFAADSARWTLASRFVRAVRPDNAGRFSVTGLPPGAYRAVASDFVADGQWEDPGFLGTLAESATRVVCVREKRQA